MRSGEECDKWTDRHEQKLGGGDVQGQVQRTVEGGRRKQCWRGRLGGCGGLNSGGFKGVHGLQSVGNREPVRVLEQGSGLLMSVRPTSSQGSVRSTLWKQRWTEQAPCNMVP